MKAKPQEKNKRATNHPTQHHWHEMNRKQRRETMRKIQSEDLSLEVIHPDAAGIDIGNESHYAAVPPSRDSQPVRCFGCTTAELKALAAWLQQCRIRTVAMQSPGVCWVGVYDTVAPVGLYVYLDNARYTKNVPCHQICCLYWSRSRMAMSSASSRWPSAIGSWSSICRARRIAATVPLCQKRSGKDGSRRKREISRSSTCVKGCFA